MGWWTQTGKASGAPPPQTAYHHLVETTNHTGWHLPTPPWIDPNVMAQALDDFGDIILPAPPPPDFP